MSTRRAPPGENRDITDDEIHLKLEALAARTPYTTLVVDACHSGTITRDAFGAKGARVEADRRPVSAAAAVADSRRPGSSRTRSGASGWMPLASTRTCSSPAAATTRSRRSIVPPEGGGPHGALTYFLCQQLRQATSGTSYRDVFEAVGARVNALQQGAAPADGGHRPTAKSSA